MVWCKGGRGSAGSFLCPRALQSTDSTLLCLGPSAKATQDRISVCLSFPLTKALTVLHLKTSCPLPSCGQLKEQLLAKKKTKIRMKAQALHWMFPVCCFINEGAIQTLKAP